jgi:hypothetical protein
MTQRLVLAALTTMTTMVLSAGPSFAPPLPTEYTDTISAPTAVVGTAHVQHSFNQLARLDTSQVQTADERMESCDLYYYESLDLLACKR